MAEAGTCTEPRALPWLGRGGAEDTGLGALHSQRPALRAAPHFTVSSGGGQGPGVRAGGDTARGLLTLLQRALGWTLRGGSAHARSLAVPPSSPGTFTLLLPQPLPQGRKRAGPWVMDGMLGGAGGAHDHVLQRVLGQPAVQKHGDEQVPQRRPEDLRGGGSGGRGRGQGPGGQGPGSGSSPTVMMKGSVLIISRTKDTRKICSQMLPWEPVGRAGRDQPEVRVGGGQRSGRVGGQREDGGLRERAGRAGTHLVAEVDEQHGLQEAYYGHDDLGEGVP